MEWCPTAQLFQAQVPSIGFRRAAERSLSVRRKPLVRSRVQIESVTAASGICSHISFGAVSFKRGQNPGCRCAHDHKVRCSETSFAETPLDVSSSSTGSSAEPFSDLSPVASPPLLSGSPEFYIDGGLALVTSLEEAEKDTTEVVAEIGPTIKEVSGSTAATPAKVVHHEGLLTSSSEGTSDSVSHEQSLGQISVDPQDTGGRLSDTRNLLDQMREILVFAGPALGIWLAGPLMSIIDTAVVGQSSSMELAALGPGTVLCDQLCYIFMFLSIATSNLIATSVAKKDKAGVAGHLSRLLFVSFACGWAMFFFTGYFSTPLLQAFVGARNAGLVPAAQSYVKIRGMAWPAVLVGMVAQSASLGMKDSWGPLRVLAVASFVNCFGDIVLCSFLGYGIAGAAWATMVSQYVGTFMMLRSINRKGYNALALSIPSLEAFIQMVEIAAPVLLTMFSKVCFYTLITYLASSLGASTLAGHQVMIGIFGICTVWGEPLCQTAQSFMPALIFGTNRNLKEARLFLKSLLIIGAIVGTSLGAIFVFVPWFVPQIFTRDIAVIDQMRSVTLPFWFATALTPPTLSCEGTLLAGRDLKYLSFSMVSCFLGGALILLLFNHLGFGLRGSWWTLVCFQLGRLVQSYSRLISPESFLWEGQPQKDLALKTA